MTDPEVKLGAQRTGRAAAVRAFLEAQTEAVSARQILDAVEPGGDINLMTATLGTLYRNRAVEKHGAGMGNVRWKTAPGKGHDRPAARAPMKERREPAPANGQARARRSSPTMVLPTQPTERKQKSNFTAAPGTTKAPAKRSCSITCETVEEFQRRGGRIQVLRLGECSQQLRYDHSSYAEHRANGRAKPKTNRAAKGA